ncbi:hypothetical protein Mycsm_01750 [Mycobacterium sp. JS623]|uniref:hypothetical protein n=1 Tax=Mycobacterium sp. JS623 TaxID=212767 RepID=UPI0002A54F12|nr:hypothetical protein [Mycobacterium sp. JS623]AGB22143.1 hypothetical protein Mycsm_01750 [Mycobacterium sp. JS623]
MKSVAAAMGAAMVVAGLSGCGHSATHELDHAQQVLATCPPNDQKLAALVTSDESGTRRGSTAEPAQQEVIRKAVERTAICGGHFRLSLFAGGVVTAGVYDGDLKLEGATETARLRKAPKVIDTTMAAINGALPSALERLDGGQTDIVGQLQPAQQYRDQLSANGQHYQLDLSELTDGIETAQVDLSDPALSSAQAEQLATTVSVPDLSGARVRVIGVGRKADGEQLPTPYVEALRAFHLAVCTRTRATTCVAVTDAAGA